MLFFTDPHLRKAKPVDQAFAKWLKKHFKGALLFDEPLSDHTTLGVGGPADALVWAADDRSLAGLLSQAQKAGVDTFVLGRGSNLLVADEGFRGLVIRLGEGFAETRVEKEKGDNCLVRAGAAAPLPGLARWAAKKGLAGLGFCAGIPASVGGALAGNAGAADGSMADFLKYFSVILANGSVRVINKEDVSWSYRKMDLPGDILAQPGGGIITRAWFELQKGEPARLLAEASRIMEQRRKNQPQRVKSAGCFFKNPPGQSAGALIDSAGLKGQSMGGAQVSQMHANFLVNLGGATALDFLRLVDRVQKKVRTVHGVELECEVRILGA